MTRVDQIFEDFNRLKVLVIGDLMIDAYTWGKVNRISPEAPVPVVNVLRREARLGGAGNVLMNVASLGATPLVVSVIGDDDRGVEMKQLIADQGISVDGLLVESGRPTTVKERVIAGSQQLLRIDSETDQPISSALAIQLVERVKSHIHEVDVILFEDYDKGVLSGALIQEIIELARNHGVPTVVDPKKRNFFSYQGASLFKPNLSELKEGLGLSDTDLNEENLAITVEKFKASQKFEGLFVTLSERGVYIDYQNACVQVPAHVRQIADVSGAGDTVISIAACALALGLSAAEVAGLANLGGGLVCESLGVVPIDKARLKAEARSLF